MSPAAKAASRRNLEKARAASKSKAAPLMSRSGKVIQFSTPAQLQGVAKKVATKRVSKPLVQHSTEMTAKSIGWPGKVKTPRGQVKGFGGKVVTGYTTPTSLHGKAIPATLRKQFPKITPQNYRKANSAFLKTMHFGVSDPVAQAIPKRSFKMPAMATVAKGPVKRKTTRRRRRG